MIRTPQQKVFFVPRPGAGPDAYLPVKNILAGVATSSVRMQPVGPSREPSYDRNYVYHGDYQNKLLRGQDVTPRPWNVFATLSQLIPKNAIIADVGCGTAYKSIRHAVGVRLLIGVEPNEVMIQRAIENAMVVGAYNVCFMTGTCDALPFEDGSIDVITAFLAPHNASEMLRVLRPGGWAIVERVGDRDKANIKACFDNDMEGPRGQLLQCPAGTRLHDLTEEFRPLFSSHLAVRNGFWDTEYTDEELQTLLEQTPTVRNYSAEHDRLALERVRTTLMVDGKVRTTQNRILVVAQK